MTQQVTISDEGRTIADFQLSQQAIGLDEIVATGLSRGTAAPASEEPQAPAERQLVPPDQPRFTPFTVRPRLSNAEEVAAALRAAYPATLRDAGVAGTTVVWVFIDAEGALRDVRVSRSSGNAQLDEAALEVAGRCASPPRTTAISECQSGS